MKNVRYLLATQRAAAVFMILTAAVSASADLKIVKQADGLAVQRDGRAIVTQVARVDFRPYLHPIIAPDGKGEVTEFSPGHHKHQTGLYWGFTRVNKRDHFHHPGDNYFKRQAVDVLTGSGASVSWRVVYDLLDAQGKPVLTETKTWSLSDHGSHYALDLTWSGRARAEVTIGKYAYGGLFLRMPWKRGIQGAAVNSAQQTNGAAEGKRAKWVDVGMQVKGRKDLAHIVIMDYPDNPGYPTPWRVDGQLGVGPCYARLGDWKISAGKSATFRHRLLIYTGVKDDDLIEEAWADHIKGAKNLAKRTPDQ